MARDWRGGSLAGPGARSGRAACRPIVASRVWVWRRSGRPRQPGPSHGGLWATARTARPSASGVNLLRAGRARALSTGHTSGCVQLVWRPPGAQAAGRPGGNGSRMSRALVTSGAIGHDARLPCSGHCDVMLHGHYGGKIGISFYDLHALVSLHTNVLPVRPRVREESFCVPVRARSRRGPVCEPLDLDEMREPVMWIVAAVDSEPQRQPQPQPERGCRGVDDRAGRADVRRGGAGPGRRATARASDSRHLERGDAASDGAHVGSAHAGGREVDRLPVVTGVERPVDGTPAPRRTGCVAGAIEGGDEPNDIGTGVPTTEETL